MTSQPYGLFRNESVTRSNQGELSPVRKSPSDQVNTSLVFFFFLTRSTMWIFFNVRVHSLRTDQMTLKETHIGLGIHQDYLLVYQFAFDQMWNNALQTIKNEKSKDYCRVDSEQPVLFFHNNISAGRTSLLQVYRCSYRRYTILLYSRRSGMLQSHNKLQLPAVLGSLISSCLIYS